MKNRRGAQMRPGGLPFSKGIGIVPVGIHSRKELIMIEVLGGDRHALLFLEHRIAGFEAHRTITFASGIESPGAYMDNRRWPSYPEVWEEMLLPVVTFAEGLKLRGKLDAIAGVESGSIMHGALVANALGLPFVYVRKEVKGHGQKKAIEGDVERVVRDRRVLVMEDVGTTGESSLKAVRALRESGGIVEDVAFLSTYGFPEMSTSFSDEGVGIRTVTTFDRILSEAKPVSYVPRRTYEIYHWHIALIREWLTDPWKPWEWPKDESLLGGLEKSSAT